MSEAVSQRESSKQHRRDRIIDTARNTIRKKGVDGLSIRTLADQAGVTVPTIYNLVGNKKAILEEIARDVIEQLVLAHKASTTKDPIAKVEEVVSQMMSIYAADEILCREVLGALERMESTITPTGHNNNPARIVAVEDCEHALEAGLLCGNFPIDVLAEGLLSAFRQAQQGWLLGRISLGEVQKRALIGCFIALAADAAPALHSRLVEKVSRLTSK